MLVFCFLYFMMMVLLNMYFCIFTLWIPFYINKEVLRFILTVIFSKKVDLVKHQQTFESIQVEHIKQIKLVNTFKLNCQWQIWSFS